METDLNPVNAVAYAEVTDRTEYSAYRIHVVTPAELSALGSSALYRAQTAPLPQLPRLLRLLSALVPRDERAGWLEEHRSSLAELPNRRARWTWTWSAVRGAPRYAYTLHTSGPKELS